MPTEVHAATTRAYAEAIQRADVVLVLVDHDQFKQVPATALAGKTVVDTKGLWR